MKRRRRIFAAVTLLALGVGAACSDYPGGGGPTQPGTLTLRLTTPHDDDGALTFELTGPGVEGVAAGASLRLFTRKVDDATIRGAVVGALANGAVVTLEVPDVDAVAQYTARVLEVADRQDALRADLTGYALAVTR